MKNWSGFSGYPLGTVYPDYGMTQADDTLPDPAEIQSLSAIDAEKNIGAVVSQRSRSQIWIALAVLIGLFFAFSAGSGR